MIQDFIPRLIAKESIEDKQRIREQLQRDVDAFLSAGGQITKAESCVTSDGQAAVRKYNRAHGFEQQWR